MPPILLNQSALSVFPQLLLAILAVPYLMGTRNKTKEVWLAIAFAGIGVMEIGFYWLILTVVPPTPWVQWFELAANSSLLLLLIPVLQSPYHYSFSEPQYAQESKLIWRISIFFFFLVTSGFVIGSAQKNKTIIDLSLQLFALIACIECLWVITAFLRRTVALDNKHQERNWHAILRQPLLPSSIGTRNFALCYIALFLVAGVTFMENFTAFSSQRGDWLYPLLVSIFLFGMGIAYTNYGSQPTSLITKLVFVLLITTLMIPAHLGYVVLPFAAKSYIPEIQIADYQEFRFSPQKNMGYQLTTGGAEIELDFGEEWVINKQNSQISFNFPFPFYDQLWTQAYIHHNGLITFGQSFDLLAFREHRQPAIAPLLEDVDEQHVSLFSKQESNQVILTWLQQVPIEDATSERTDRQLNQANQRLAQLILHKSGHIDFIYQNFTENLRFANDPTQGIWLIGLLPGNGTVLPEPVQFSGTVSHRGEPGQAIIQNFYLDFRKHIHEQALLILYYILGAFVLITIASPYCYQFVVINPLNALMAGVKRVNEGDLNVTVAKQFNDELGYLTQTFNQMIRSIQLSQQKLQEMNTSLEVRVAERTEDLLVAKPRFRTIKRE